MMRWQSWLHDGICIGKLEPLPQPHSKPTGWEKPPGKGSHSAVAQTRQVRNWDRTTAGCGVKVCTIQDKPGKTCVRPKRQ